MRGFAILLCLLCLSACGTFSRKPPPTLALAPVVEIAEGVQPDEVAASCNWLPVVPATMQKEAKGMLAPPAADQPDRHLISVRVQRFEVTPDGRERDYLVVLRAHVQHRGKLVGFLDYKREFSIESNEAPCPVFSKVARKAAAEFEDWLRYTRFVECGEGCTDMHPDEPIAMSPSLVRPERLQSFGAGCGWEKTLIDRIAKKYEGDRAESAPALVFRQGDVREWEGRKLLLRLDDGHVVGGQQFTGPKWIIVSGDLIDHGFVTASFTWQLQNGGSWSECKTLTSFAEDSGDFVGRWLLRPSHGTKNLRPARPLDGVFQILTPIVLVMDAARLFSR
ncbi:hypothetical protein [Viridibacterium curvum]|uniref:Lipoprotein n=1 Tax=Viridibacterium curvum TaxID=1101404 RepID=A0ABP9QXF5_9RHOO